MVRPGIAARNRAAISRVNSASVGLAKAGADAPSTLKAKMKVLTKPRPCMFRPSPARRAPLSRLWIRRGDRASCGRAGLLPAPQPIGHCVPGIAVRPPSRSAPRLATVALHGDLRKLVCRTRSITTDRIGDRRLRSIAKCEVRLGRERSERNPGYVPAVPLRGHPLELAQPPEQLEKSSKLLRPPI